MFRKYAEPAYTFLIGILVVTGGLALSYFIGGPMTHLLGMGAPQHPIATAALGLATVCTVVAICFMIYAIGLIALATLDGE
jgi:hypothetical protein